MLFALAGLSAGLAHVPSSPDHLAAAAPLAAQGRERAWRTGLVWSLGHASGVWGVGLAALLLKDLLPLAALDAGAGRACGVLLVLFGLFSLWRVSSPAPTSHDHHAVGTASFALGATSSLAGSAQLLALLPLLAASSRGGVLAYMAGFTLGTIVAFLTLTYALGWLAGRWSGRAQQAYSALCAAGAGAAIAGGLYCLWLPTG